MNDWIISILESTRGQRSHVILAMALIALLMPMSLFPGLVRDASAVPTSFFTLDGSNYYDVPYYHSLSLEKFSLAAWFKFTKNYSTATSMPLIANKGGFESETAGKNMNYGIWVGDGSTDGNKIGGGFETSSGTDYYLMSSAKYNDGQWHYAVLTYDKAVLRLYLDGVQVASKSTTATPDTTGTQPLRIGANSLLTDRYFTGQIEIKLWNRAVTASEVTSQYTLGSYSTKGLMFLGINYIDLASTSSLSLEKFSLSSWFKTSKDYSKATDKSLIANKGGFESETAGKNMNYGIWVESGSTDGNKIGGGFETTSGTDMFLMSEKKYNDGQWHYAVLTHDGSTLRLYLDGVQVASKSTAAVPDDTGTQRLRLGANSLSADRYFTGEIDDAKVVSSILTTTTISDQFLSGISSRGGYTIPAIAGIKPTTVTYGPTIKTVCNSGCTHTTIASAIDSLPATGGKVVLKANTFTVSSTLYLRSNLVLQFEQGAAIKYTGPGPAIYGRNINNVKIINPVVTTSNAVHTLYFEIADTIIVDGGKITGEKGSTSAGFKCNNCKNILVQNGSYSNYVRPIDVGTIAPAGCTEQICKLTGDTRNVWLVGNTISDSSIECAQFNYGYDMHAIGNTIFDCSLNGLDIGFNNGVEAKNNKIYDTGFSTQDRGVGMHTDSSNKVVVIGNSIDRSGTNGIVVCGSDNNYILANTITSSGTIVTSTLFNDYGTGINVINCTGGAFDAQNTIIDHNTVKNSNDGYGVYISLTSKPSQITNNVLLYNEKGPYKDHSYSSVIKGNTIG